MASLRDRMMEKTKNLPCARDIYIPPPKILEDGTVILTGADATPQTPVGARFQHWHYNQRIIELKLRALDERIDIDSEWSTPLCLQISGLDAFSTLYRLQITYFSLRFYVKARYPHLPHIVTHQYDWPEPFFRQEDNQFLLPIWGNKQW